MRPRTYRKRPTDVQAVRVTDTNQSDIVDWISLNGGGAIVEYGNVKIKTLEGVMLARIGSWVVRGAEGEFYPCKSSIFDQTYDIVIDGRTALDYARITVDQGRHFRDLVGVGIVMAAAGFVVGVLFPW